MAATRRGPAHRGRPPHRRQDRFDDARRALGRSLGIATVEASCDDAVARVQRRLPTFQRYANPLAVLEPMDRQVARAALEALQEWHNAEQAAYAAMRDGAQAVPRPSPDGKTGARLAFAAAALWRGITTTRG